MARRVGSCPAGAAWTGRLPRPQGAQSPRPPAVPAATYTLAHVSDVHFGAIGDARVVDALVDPELGDVLPSTDRDPLARTAWRLRMLERDREIRAVQAQGVPVVPWLGPGSLDVVLRELARRGRRVGV